MNKMLNDKEIEVRNRFIKFREKYPMSYAAIGRIIGLGNKRYVLCRFARGCNGVRQDTLQKLDEYLRSEGF